MASFHRTVFLGHDLALFLPEPNWRTAVEITARLEALVDEGRTGRENRSPRHFVLRLEQSGAWSLPKAETAEIEAALATLGTPTTGERVYVGLPIFPDRLAPAEWGERIFSAQWVINYDETGYAIYAHNAVPGSPARRWLAPLLVGRLAARPILRALNEDESQFTMKLLERSPWDFRIAPAAEGVVGADWPAALQANWRELPESATEDVLVYEDVGAGRVEALDGQEGTTRRRQQSLVTLQSRAQIRTLLNFFLARKGRIQSFTAPWLLQPGADLPETPHTTKARFAEDGLRLSFVNQDQANTKVTLLQVPWEIAGVGGETPEQPAVAYFYKFSLQVPGGPVVWRFTNWESNLVRAGDGTYLGDASGLFQHDQITQTIDLSDEPTTIGSWMFADNPLLRVVQRTLDMPLEIEIRRGNPAAPDAALVVYAGEVANVAAEGRRLSAATIVLGGLLDIKVPGLFFGPTCNYQFCGAGCTLDPVDWTFAGTVASQVGNDLTLNVTINPPAAALVDDYFAKAWVKKGAGAAFELRQVVRSEDLGGGQQKFTLKKPLRAFVVGDALTFRPYCSGTRGECATKFANYVNFGGHPHIAPRNLSVPARTPATPTGKK